MKKTITLLLCLTMAFCLSATLLTGCGTISPATAIEVVDPVTEYYVDGSVDYDSLRIKITYADGSTKEGTLKSLKLSVSEKADLSKVGDTAYTVTFGSLKYVVNVSVKEVPKLATAFGMPSFYANYLNASKERAETEVEERGDFRKTGEIYEVGNVNKFIFRPYVTALDETDTAVNISNPKTTVKVYEKLTADGEYVLVPDTDLEGIVAIDDNTYKFTDEAAGRYYKLQITLDEEAYDLSLVKEENRTITAEFKVVGGGYNVYDQLGLSVMNDLNSGRWIDVWNCTIDENYKLTAKADSLKLEADDKPLCEYVENIDWVILHASFAIDADKLPANFFWTEDSEDFKTAQSVVSGVDGAKDLLVGSLKDGIGNDKWYHVMNYNDSTNVAPQLGHYTNMQKGLFSTYRVSVSGNYNSITIPETASKEGRNLFSVLEHELSNTNRNNPMPHWNLFQMVQSHNEGMKYAFTIKNIATSGNLGQKDTSKFVPAGLNMMNCYGENVSIENVIGQKFYTNVTCDSYGANSFNAVNTKLYDAYSNMFYMWRTNVTVNNCELKGSGGPLFILCDGNNTTTTLTGGPTITVDTKSVLEAYATGSESWYSLNNATALIGMLRGTLETEVLNKLGKSVLFTKDGSQYVNVLAAMICEPGDLLAGDSKDKIIVRGTYKTVDETGKVIEEFTVQNPYVQMLSAAVGGDATKFAPVFQTASYMTYANLLESKLYTFNGMTPQDFGQLDGYNWMTDNSDKLAVYMSAGPIASSPNAPYFGVVVGSQKYTPAA